MNLKGIIGLKFDRFDRSLHVINSFPFPLRIGLAPDFLMCRGGKPVVEGARDKLSMFCQVNTTFT